MSCTNQLKAGDKVIRTGFSIFQRHLRNGCTFRMQEGIIHMYFNGTAYYLSGRDLHGKPAWYPNAGITDMLKRGVPPRTIWYEGEVVFGTE